jgi:hypothetical protein
MRKVAAQTFHRTLEWRGRYFFIEVRIFFPIEGESGADSLGFGVAMLCYMLTVRIKWTKKDRERDGGLHVPHSIIR